MGFKLFGVIVLGISAALNIIVTTLIGYRVVSLRKSIDKLLGKAHRRSGRQYTSALAVFVESAALYVIAILVGIILLALGNTGEPIALALVGEIQVRNLMSSMWIYEHSDGGLIDHSSLAYAVVHGSHFDLISCVYRQVNTRRF